MEQAVHYLLMTVYLAGALAVIRGLVSWRARSRGRPLPPGLAPLPLIGNLLDVPKARPWEGYRDLCAKYGDFTHLSVFGRHYLILGSADVIFRYLDKRSANTSDRLQTCLLELVRADINFTFMPYGQAWRAHRRAFWQHFHPNVVPEYRHLQRAAAHRFLHKISTNPSQFVEHVRYSFSAAIMKAVYANDIDGDIHNHMKWVDEYQEGISQGLVPGKYLVEVLPFLRRLPSYFLGPELRQKIPGWRGAARHLREVGIARVKEEMVEQGDNPSMVGKLLHKIAEDADSKAPTEGILDEEMIKKLRL